MTDTNTKPLILKNHLFLAGGGEMGELMRQKDWSATIVGGIDSWPQSLRTTLSILLNSRFPMFLFWGPRLVCFYNDAYRPSLGINGKHPGILGMPGEQAWPDIWAVIKPMLDQVIYKGEATWNEDQLIPIYRNGQMEDVYWTFSYSPVNDESGKTAGVFVTCTETTEKVLVLRKIEASEQQFHDTVKQAPMGIALLKGENFIVEMVNDAYLELVDKAESDFVGKPLFNSLPEVKEIVEPLLNKVLQSGIAYNATELKVTLNRYGKAEDGYFDLVYQPFLERDGRISGIMVVANEVTSAVKAKYSLVESANQFRNMVMHSPIPMAIFRGPDHIIEMANTEMFKNIWRKEEADVIGKKVLNIFPELKDQKYAELLKKVLHTGNPHRENESIAYVQGDDGLKKFYLDYEYAPLFETDGTVSGIMITVNDVTEKVAAREKIKDSEEKLRVAIDATSLGTFDINMLTDEIEYSERYLEIYGFRADERPTRQEVIDTLHPEDKIIRAQRFEEALTTGMLEYEARVVHRRNPIKWIRVKGTIIYDIHNRAIRTLGTVLDITKQKNALSIIRENEVRLRLATEGTKLATWDLDLQTRNILYSPRLAEIFGHDQSAILTHQAMRAQIHPDDIQDTVEKAFDIALRTGFYDYEARVVKPDKTICWIKTQGNVLFDHNKVPLRIIGTMADITESKNNEEKLAKLAAIVQGSEDAIIGKRLDGIVTSWNNAAERIFGYTADEMIGFSITKLIPEDRKEEEVDIITMLKKGERINSFETKRLRKDGVIIDISITISPIKDPHGNIIGASKIARDITAQKETERRLIENEHRLNIAVNSVELGTWEINLLTDELNYSSRYLEIMGHDTATIPGRDDLVKNIHPDDLVIRNKVINAALKTGFLDVELRLLTGEPKTVKWIRSRGRVFYDAQQNPVKIMGTTMDITRQKTIFETLRQSEERFRVLANVMPQLVWTSDAEGHLNYFNQSVYDYSGYSKEALEKDGWLQIVHPDDRDENIEKWLQAVKTGEPFLLEHRFRKHTGEYRWQLSRATPQKDGNDNIQMWVGSSTDIHEIKESEQQKDFFISMASHELKTPITSIKGYVQILMSMYEKSSDDFLKNSLNTVNKQIITLTNLIGDLLDLSKIKSGSLQLNKENFSLNQMVKEVIDGVQHTEPGHTIIFDPGEECTLNADRERIGQVLINFLTNAIKYSPDSNAIQIRSFINGSFAVVSVEDKGIGISKADQEKIFHRFYRVEGKNEKTFPGFGIGLFIASEIIERHKGKIKVESEPGKGSVFSFLLPLENNT